MITALCNIFINSEDKLNLFKETFPLVYKISDNWLVYIRGKYRKKVIAFIKRECPDYQKNIIFFNNLFENNWAMSSAKMIEKSKYDYIYVFLEDHFLMRPLKHFGQVLHSMKKNKIDYFQYSFFNVGLSTNSIEHLHPDSDNHFNSFDLKLERIPVLQKTNKSFYPYSLTGILSKQFFSKLLDIEKKYLIKVPFLMQVLMENIFFFYPKDRAFWFRINQIVKYLGLRFVIYPLASPFNLEKSLFDCEKELLPYRIGVLKEELFANWDDDNKLSDSSLIKRGLYPKYFRLNIQAKPNLNNSRDYFLAKGESKKYQYCPDIQRITKIPKKYIYVKKGILQISSSSGNVIIKKGKSAWIVASIPHKFFAIESCIYSYYIDY